jgi:hypothetical protein
MVVETGVTVTGMPVKPPGFHTNVVPTTLLMANNEEESPLHIEAGVAVVVILGFGLTVTVTVLLPVQPTEVVPVTVYVVVEAGVTDTGVSLKAPGIQTYVVPTTLLLADKLEEAPLHIVDGVAVGVTTGFGLTVIVSIAEQVLLAASVPVTV